MGITALGNVFEEIEQLGNTSSGIDKIATLNHQIIHVFEQVVAEMKSGIEVTG